MTRRIASLLRTDHGFSLVELIIASGIFLVLLIAVLNVLDTGTRAERGEQARHDAMLQLRGSMTRMTKEVRQATWIDPASSQTRLSMKTLLSSSSVPIPVVYEVVGSELRRTVNGGTALPIATNVTTATKFCYDPSCSLSQPPITLSDLTEMKITIALTPAVKFAGGAITMATEIDLRNLNG